MRMRTDRINVNHALAVAKLPSKDYLAISEESGGTAHLLRREWRSACRILITLLVCSSIISKNGNSRNLEDSLKTSPGAAQTNKTAAASTPTIVDAAPQDMNDFDEKLPSNRKETQNSAELSAALAKAFYEKRDFDAAIREADAAIKLDPNMASAYYFRGASYQQKAEYYIALVDYNRALHFDPKYTNALGGRADVYYFTHQNRLAIEDYTAFIAAMPISPVAYARRATCHYALGEYGQTVLDYEKAIALDPNLLEAINGLAWVLATSPVDGIRNGLRAVGYGEKAVSLAGQNEKFLYMDTLATAYAEAGRFTDAVSMQTKAISLIPENYDAKESAQFKVRLQSYKEHKPWRE
jgi:tetratricopeptide (TPR) repeat protein